MADEFSIFPKAAIHLPGTVALPSPFPKVGHLWLQSPKQLSGLEDEESELVAIGVSIPPTTTIVRYVLVKFVSAIFLLKEPSDAEKLAATDWKNGTWLFPPKLHEGLAKTSRGIVYVPESAPVLTQAVCGQTAAESAEHIGIHMQPMKCDPFTGCDCCC
ncbi:MAG TPA: hypothetical protein VGH32_07690 [Pirellulales bacterium]|jgi:hypothetical protein